MNKDERFSEIIDNFQRGFSKNYCTNCSDSGDIFWEVYCFEIPKTYKKIPITKPIEKLLQIMGFAYTKIMRFPDEDFCIPSLIATNLFESISQRAYVKIRLHHSHVTGKILGYAQDLCNWTVEKNLNFTRLMHNSFG